MYAELQPVMVLSISFLYLELGSYTFGTGGMNQMSLRNHRFPVTIGLTGTIVFALALTFTSVVFLNCMIVDKYDEDEAASSIQYSAALGNADKSAFTNFLDYLKENQIEEDKAYASVPLTLGNSRGETTDVLLITPLEENRDDALVYLGDGRFTDNGVLMESITREMLFSLDDDSFYDKDKRDKVYTDTSQEIPIDGVVNFAGIRVQSMCLYAGNSYFFRLTDSFNQLVFVFDRPLDEAKEKVFITGLREHFQLEDIERSPLPGQSVNRERSYTTIVLLIALSAAIIGVLRLFGYVVRTRRKEYCIRILVGATEKDIILEQMKFLFVLFVPSVLLGSLLLFLSEISTPDILLFPNLSLSIFVSDLFLLLFLLFAEEMIFAWSFSRKLKIRSYGDI